MVRPALVQAKWQFVAGRGVFWRGSPLISCLSLQKQGKVPFEGLPMTAKGCRFSAIPCQLSCHRLPFLIVVDSDVSFR